MGTKNDRVAGKVAWFNSAKGYGFITPDKGKTDVFVHYTGIAAEGFRNLRPGDEVMYTVVQGPKGQQAENVVVTKEAE